MPSPIEHTRTARGSCQQRDELARPGIAAARSGMKAVARKVAASSRAGKSWQAISFARTATDLAAACRARPRRSRYAESGQGNAGKLASGGMPANTIRQPGARSRSRAASACRSLANASGAVPATASLTPADEVNLRGRCARCQPGADVLQLQPGESSSLPLDRLAAGCVHLRRRPPNHRLRVIRHTDSGDRRIAEPDQPPQYAALPTATFATAGRRQSLRAPLHSDGLQQHQRRERQQQPWGVFVDHRVQSARVCPAGLA